MDYLTFYYFSRVMMVLGFGLAVADVFSTIAALAYGGREANPLWRWVMAGIAYLKGPKALWGIPRILLALGIIWLGVGNAFAPYVWWKIPAAIVPNLVLAYVVWNNFGIAKMLRERARSNLQ
jgi:hypothetical protein